MWQKDYSNVNDSTGISKINIKKYLSVREWANYDVSSKEMYKCRQNERLYYNEYISKVNETIVYTRTGIWIIM